MDYNINLIRSDFPILTRRINNKPFVYFDNAATTQKPLAVINKISEIYKEYNSNIHRGVHFLSDKMTDFNESARKNIQSFINAKSYKEIIFTSGTTESINLVATSFADTFINEDDEIVVSEMEHHSNIVPWQLAANRKKAKIKVLPFDDNGELVLSKLNDIINDRTKIIAVTHISNSLGTINSIRDIIKIAHKKNIPVLIDGAQAIHHLEVDVQELDCDFYAFSGHKTYGPTGTGVLYGKQELLEKMSPYKGGGEMISSVSFEHTTFNELPFKFEAGTPNFVGIIAMAEAINYIKGIGLKNIKKHEDNLLSFATKELNNIDGVKIIGNAKQKAGVISFLFDNFHPFDTGVLLDQLGIAARTGSHCAETVMKRFGIDGTIRISFGLYNTEQEVQIFIDAMKRIKKML